MAILCQDKLKSDQRAGIEWSKSWNEKYHLSKRAPFSSDRCRDWNSSSSRSCTVHRATGPSAISGWVSSASWLAALLSNRSIINQIPTTENSLIKASGTNLWCGVATLGASLARSDAAGSSRTSWRCKDTDPTVRPFEVCKRTKTIDQHQTRH